ncbi:hypothetical protein NQ318_016790, partial [Aromia moschata]
VVSLALYAYFIAALLGRQFVPYADKSMQTKWEAPDVYFPFFTALQFCFYIGWLKVAEVLINPFGEDDDDIELNWLIDRHIKAGYMIVDEMHEEHPELLKDQYWDDVVPKELPYTVASEHYRREEPKGSAESYKVKSTDAMYANLVVTNKKSLHDDMYADYESVDTPIVERRKSSNWFSRQISRTGMGSIRSASTAYSSGDFSADTAGIRCTPIRRTDSSLDCLRRRCPSTTVWWGGDLEGAETLSKVSGKFECCCSKAISFGFDYKSHALRRSKFNGAAAMQVKSRPRIPTPDVTKEVVDRENRLAASVAHVQNQMSTGLTLMSHQLPANYPSYPAGDVPVVQVVLSPIQELDGTGSVNNTLHANQPGTAALAQAVLSPGLGPVLAASPAVSVPMTVSQLTSLGLTSHHNSPLLARTFDHQSNRSPTFIQASRAFEPEKPAVGPAVQPLTLTEVHPEDEQPLSSRSSNTSAASEISHCSKDSIVSNMSNTTASMTSKRSLETPCDPAAGDDHISDLSAGVSMTVTPQLERKSSFVGEGRCRR